MNIIAVDDEYLALCALEQTIKEAIPGSALQCFQTTEEALEFAQNTPIDIAFLDIQMGQSDGISLAQELKGIRPNTNIIFVTAFDNYAPKAFSLHASGYIQKPVSAEDIKDELKNLRFPIQKDDAGIRIQTFGKFEVFVDGKMLHFNRSKSKEILAYLVDRQGRAVSRKELANILWADELYTRKVQNHLQVLIANMMEVLKNAGADHLILRGSDGYSIDISAVDCDYFRFLDWEIQAIDAYQGEYMTNYSWSEYTAGLLSRKKFG